MHEHCEHHHHHDHDHEHHGMEQHISPKKLLESMYSHNCGHLDELRSVADGLNDEAKQKVMAAIEMLKQGNDMLGQAIDSVKED